LMLLDVQFVFEKFMERCAKVNDLPGSFIWRRSTRSTRTLIQYNGYRITCKVEMWSWNWKLWQFWDVRSSIIIDLSSSKFSIGTNNKN
jgi:hypothetical protein